jgi:hypothetical protein
VQLTRREEDVHPVSFRWRTDRKQDRTPRKAREGVGVRPTASS